MAYLNIEIKAKCHHPESIRKYLKEHNAEFRGLDTQTDTYFHTRQGRLKLREGNIENNLIFYERTDQQGPKSSHFHLVNIPAATEFKQVLEKAIGVKVIVKKKREIWFIENVKFHIDEIQELGNFVEIEASNVYADLSKEKLQEQCDFYMNEFGIRSEDLISNSYSDMVMKKAII